MRLVLDLVTNKKLSVGKNTCHKVSSTGCEPALKGDELTYGMCRTYGVIEMSLIENGDIR
ncbi:hypothetical protein [Clostridium sp. 001]|uniref:hypothetical protein n=1 Tax=Clostridium sp. 001 TaxID=1970093 RepID=UPI001C2B87C4|nr:hypothetical protein [Clostridium sp. 001]